MSDRGMIIVGLVLFLALFTFPIRYNLASGTVPKGPELQRPAGERDPFAPAEEMRRSHMRLLMEWRDKVVRQQVRETVGLDGKTYPISLTQTCLGCHTSKVEFCDRCHERASVTLTCWSCHVDPKLIQKKLVQRSER